MKRAPFARSKASLASASLIGDQVRSKMDQHYPRFGEQYRLPFPYEPDQDDGKGM
jgi:hypothetical protein